MSSPSVAGGTQRFSDLEQPVITERSSGCLRYRSRDRKDLNSRSYLPPTLFHVPEYIFLFPFHSNSAFGASRLPFSLPFPGQHPLSPSGGGWAGGSAVSIFFI